MHVSVCMYVNVRMCACKCVYIGILHAFLCCKGEHLLLNS